MMSLGSLRSTASRRCQTLPLSQTCSPHPTSPHPTPPHPPGRLQMTQQCSWVAYSIKARKAKESNGEERRRHKGHTIFWAVTSLTLNKNTLHSSKVEKKSVFYHLCASGSKPIVPKPHAKKNPRQYKGVWRRGPSWRHLEGLPKNMSFTWYLLFLTARFNDVKWLLPLLPLFKWEGVSLISRLTWRCQNSIIELVKVRISIIPVREFLGSNSDHCSSLGSCTRDLCDSCPCKTHGFKTHPTRPENNKIKDSRKTLKDRSQGWVTASPLRGDAVLVWSHVVFPLVHRHHVDVTAQVVPNHPSVDGCPADTWPLQQGRW